MLVQEVGALRILPAVQEPFGPFVEGVEDILAHGAGGRDHDVQGLVSGALAVDDDVVQRLPLFPGGDLVHDGRRRVQTVQGVAVRCQRPEDAVVEVGQDLAHERPRPFLQARRLVDHLLRFVPAQLRLVPRCGHGVDLRTVLRVGEEHVQPDAGGEGGFAVFAADHQEELPEPAPAIGVQDPEEHADHAFLPEEQLHRLPAVLALGLPAELTDEAKRVFRPLLVVVVITGCIQLPDDLTVNGPDLLADGLLAAADQLPVFPDVVRHS